MSASFNPFEGYPNQSKIGDYITIVSDATGGNVAYAATFNFNPNNGQHEEDVYYVRVFPAGGPTPTPTPTATSTATPTATSTATPTATPTTDADAEIWANSAATSYGLLQGPSKGKDIDPCDVSSRPIATQHPCLKRRRGL